MNITLKQPLIEAPELDCDKRWKARYPNEEPFERQLIERKVIANLIAHLGRAGFVPHSVYDGGETIKTPDTKAAMEEIFGVDESWLRMQHPVHGSYHTVYIVLGNDGWDCVADWHYSAGDPDGFDAAMEAFDFDQFDPRGA